MKSEGYMRRYPRRLRMLEQAGDGGATLQGLIGA
jgi:hypothetical protein